jgi:Exonuclease VII small subunit
MEFCKPVITKSNAPALPGHCQNSAKPRRTAVKLFDPPTQASVNVPSLRKIRPEEGSVSDKATAASPSFEQTISELETIVNEMEQGDLPLHEALKKI